MNHCLFIWGGQCKKNALLHIFYCLVWEVISKTRASCFIRGFKHLETDESTRPQAECFYCFTVFGSPDETLALVFDISLLLSLSAVLQGICCCFQIYLCHCTSHFALFCCWITSYFCPASYFVTLPLFNIISVADHFAPSSYFVELFSRLIATLRVVLSALWRVK